MAAASTTPIDAWKEVCKIGIIPAGATTAIEFVGYTEDITAMDWGEKDIEGIAMLNGGRVVKYTPMTDETLTLKIYPTKANGLVTDTDFAASLFHATAQTATIPAVVDNTYARQTHGVILLWSETLPATSQTLPAVSKKAYRIQIVNAYMTKYTPSFDDKILTAEVSFKWAPMQKDGTKNKREDSTDGSAQLAAAITSSTTI